MKIKSDVDLKILKRASFDQVHKVCTSLFDAFHPEGLGDGEELDERFHSHWILFLHTVGWTEDDYWDEREELEQDGVCLDCGESVANHGEDENLTSLPNPEKKNDPNKGMN